MNEGQFNDPESHMCRPDTVSILISNTRGGRFEPFYTNNHKHLRKTKL